MTHVRFFARWRLVLGLLAAISLLQVVGYTQTAQAPAAPAAQAPRPAQAAAPAKLHPHRIAVFGSSVANGTGDEFALDGYTGLLRTMMAPRGWEVLNQSRGGDDTTSMAPRFAPEGTPDPRVRYLLPVRPSYVVIALSFGNEGLFEAKTTAEKDAVYEGYLKGIRGFVDRARQNDIVPVVALAYPRDVQTPADYEYVRRANVVQQSWDVPTVNFLGAIDDAMGHWALGFNDKHPQASGHREMFYSFVPTLFAALEKGKPTPTRSATAKGFARIAGGAAPLTFAPDDTMHPFAVSVMVRAQGNGTVLAVAGTSLTAKIETRKNGNTEFQGKTLLADKPFTAAIAVQNGKWTYKSAAGTVVDSGISADNAWHHIVLSQYTARGETLFYVDGKLGGKVAERLQPARFVVGGPGGAGPAGPTQADYKDLMIFRAALNADEVAVLTSGKLLQGSLEIYAPLADAQFAPGSAVENRAQSMTTLKVGTDRITHTDEPGTTN